jgi:prevent-host-death family protein
MEKGASALVEPPRLAVKPEVSPERRIHLRSWAACKAYAEMYTFSMHRSYSVASARAKLAEIIDVVEDGEDVEIVRRGRKVAILISPARYARMSGEEPAFGDAYDAFMKDRDPKIFGFDAGTLEASRDRSVGRAVKL